MRPWWRFLLVLFGIVLFLIPGYIFFALRARLGFFSGESALDFAGLIFPFFGLYAFTLIWFQIMLGTFMIPLTRLFPALLAFHQIEGVIAFLFALTHPALFVIARIPSKGWLAALFPFDAVEPSNLPYLLAGELALFLLTLSVITALFRRTKLFARIWRKIHFLNYLIFVLAFIHSVNLGTDVRVTPLRYLWAFFFVTALLGFLYRRGAFRKEKPSLAKPESLVNSQTTEK